VLAGWQVFVLSKADLHEVMQYYPQSAQVPNRLLQ
jgi:hypothetical protein